MGKITFEFKISRWSNFYFFVQNLSEWHFSCRKVYNKAWLTKTGPLSDEEKNALLTFSDIRKKYPESKSIFEKSFFLFQNPLDNLSNNLNITEGKAIKKILDTFEKRFDIIYKNDLPLLHQWQEKLNANKNSLKSRSAIVKKLETFYGITLTEDNDIICFLLLSSDSSHGGGANVSNDVITYELSHYSPENIKNIEAGIWHETIHLVFERENFLRFLIKYFKNDMEKVFMYRELIASSLFPQGVLGNMFLEQKLTKNLYKYFSTDEVISASIINLSKRYVEKRLTIDNNYINTIVSLQKNKG